MPAIGGGEIVESGLCWPRRRPAPSQASEGIFVASADRPGPLTASRRQLFALAAVLAATSLTGVAAIAGLTRTVPAAPTSPQVGQTITPAGPTQPRRVEPGD